MHGDRSKLKAANSITRFKPELAASVGIPEIVFQEPSPDFTTA
jgi:hypothetical protein